ncbi:sulfatase [Haloferula chungangensis]|uniref:Sulfatase n=1 Tax=Haloferula chungangensis TaxID=1048331 RepID=A0ABW2L5B9_9BACT
MAMKLISLIILFTGVALGGDVKPNILWITSEDNSAHWLGCYGNEDAQTPRLDALAKEGFRFQHGYSNAPVCAVARSTILNGAYAVTQGTEHMRSRHPIPSKYRSYVSYLRENGYYCTNKTKTDYNFRGDDRAVWDDCSPEAHYKSRPEGAPFFAVFNLTETHESSLFPKKNQSDATRLKPEDVTVPPYLPDLPEVRSDIAKYHDRISLMDRKVGELLDELESAGLAEDTIVFYYSDHGGILPRGKRYLKETGVRVPMMVRVPAKFQNLSPFKSGEVVDELVAFVDLAPTVLSLIGLDTPEQMQGRAFLGEKRKDAPKDDMVFLFGDRFDEIYGMRRGLTDGRWKYIRRFTPNKPAAPYSFYQFSMPSWVAWQDAWQEGKLSKEYAQMWEAPQEVEELYDLESDPWEIENLAKDPAQAERLASMRSRLKGTMIEVRDTGLVPEPMWVDLVGEGTIADYVASPGFKIDDVATLAFLSGEKGDAAAETLLSTAAKTGDAISRSWVLQASLFRGKPLMEHPEKGLEDETSLNRIMTAQLLYSTGEKEVAAKAMFDELRKDISPESVLYLTNAIYNLGLIDEVPRKWAKEVMADKKAGEYVKRFAKRVLEE